jgi:protoporphyrinogen/coproporphyrinogen III oxidase
MRLWFVGVLCFGDYRLTIVPVCRCEPQASDGSEILTSTRVIFLEPSSTGRSVRVMTRNAEGVEHTAEFDQVIAAVPSTVLAKALPASRTSLDVTRQFLGSIPRASAAVVNVGYRQNVLQSHNGFGYLVPSSQKQPALGVVWDSCTFPNQGRVNETRLSVMMGEVSVCPLLPETAFDSSGFHCGTTGGARHPDIVNQTPEALTLTALSVLQKHMGITTAPDCVVAGVHVDCIPQPAVGHVNSVNNARADLDNYFQGRLQLIGNSYDGIGAADCVGNAAVCANRLLKTVQQ